MEKFIRDNRSELDDRETPGHVWPNIKFRLGGARPASIWWKAAAVFFFALSAFLLIRQTPAVPVGNDNSEFNEVETFYMEEISQKREMITDLSNMTVMDQEAERDLQRLDAMYEVLKEELKVNPSKQVVDALILNLIVRIDILNDELERVADEQEESAT